MEGKSEDDRPGLSFARHRRRNPPICCAKSWFPGSRTSFRFVLESSVGLPTVLSPVTSALNTTRNHARRKTAPEKTTWVQLKDDSRRSRSSMPLQRMTWPPEWGGFPDRFRRFDPSLRSNSLGKCNARFRSRKSVRPRQMPVSIVIGHRLRPERRYFWERTIYF